MGVRKRREEAGCADPASLFANCFANGSKCLTEQIFPSPLAWVVGSGIIRPETNAPHWVQRAGFSQTFVASAQKVMLHGGILREFGVVPDNTAFCFSLSQTAESKLRTPQPMRSCVLGSGYDMMSSTARWSLKRIAVSAIINCLAQEYDTPSTPNYEGDHCEK